MMMTNTATVVLVTGNKWNGENSFIAYILTFIMVI